MTWQVGSHMLRNIIEHNVVTRFLTGMTVLLTMSYGAKLLASLLVYYEFPYGAWVGIGIGHITVFMMFAAWYTRFGSRVESK